MKYFLILFTFLISLNAFADREIGFDITTMKNQGSKPANPKVGHGKVFLKNGKLVSIDNNGKETQYGVNGNLVKNSSFESFTALEDWSVSTITPTRTTNSRVTGEYGIEFTASAAQQGLFQYVDIPPSLVGELLEYSFYVQSNEDVEVCSLNDSIVSVCKTYYGNSSQGMRKVIVTDRPKNTNANANGVLLRTRTANLSNVKADDARVGLPQSDEAIVAKFDNTTGWVPCTFSTLAWQGLGTVTNNLECKRDKTDLLMRGNFIVGTTSASIPLMPLPTNYGAISYIHKTNTHLGIYFPSEVNAYHGGGLLSYTGGTSIAFADRAVFSNYSLGPLNVTGSGSNVTTVSNAVSVQVSVPIAEWSVQSNAALVACKEGPLKCTNTFVFKRFSPDLFALDQFGNSYPVTKGANTGYSILNLSSLGLANPMICTATLSGGSNFFGWTTMLNPSTNAQVTVYTVNAAGTAAVDAGFNITCTKQGSDYNEAYDRIVIQKDDADIRATEWLTGGFDYISNKPIYKRCHYVSTNITTNTTLTTWPTNLNPKDIFSWGSGNYVIQSSYVSSGYGALVFYNKSSGSVSFEKSGSALLEAGSTLCMEYTR